MDPDVIYFFVFVVLCFFTIFPTTEIESVGLTVDQLLSRYIHDGFVQYHMKATSLKLILHMAMPIAYIATVHLMGWVDSEAAEVRPPAAEGFVQQFAWRAFVSLSLALVVFALITAFYWSTGAWQNHPMVKQLQAHTNPATLPSWQSVATNINDEYRRDTKLVLRLNAISTLVVTDSWIIKTNLYGVNIAHQSGTMMVAYKVCVATQTRTQRKDEVK